MQPWKISVGLTAIICAGALNARRRGIFLDCDPTFGWSSPISGSPSHGTQGLALVTLMFSIYSGARLMGLADMGRKVDLMERSIRRGEGGQADLAEKMEQEERGEYPGA